MAIKAKIFNNYPEEVEVQLNRFLKDKKDLVILNMLQTANSQRSEITLTVIYQGLKPEQEPSQQ